MQVNKKSLKPILGTFFDIPNYQRLYSWNEDNWYDLYESFLNNYESNNYYFLGSLIIKTQNQPNIVDVIDGQQRLTTICILLKSISDIFSEDSDSFSVNSIKKILKEEIEEGQFKYRIAHNKVDKKNFEFIIDSSYEQIEIKYPKEQIQPNMVRAYNFFYNILQGKEYNSKKNIYQKNADIKIFSSNDLKQLYKFILDYCQLIEIALDDKDSEQEIFNTMNSTGLKLSTGDLLKNYFFQNQTLEEKYLKKWQSIFEEEDTNFSGDEKINFWSEILSSNRGNTNLDLIMYSALLIEETKGENFTTFQQQTTYKDLFNVYKKILKTEKDKENILNNIFELSQAYLILFNLDKNKIDYNKKLNLLLFIIQKSGYNVFYPLILFLYNDSKINNKDKAYIEISKLLVFNSIFSKETNYLSKLVSSLLKIVQTDGLKEMIEEINKVFSAKISHNINDLVQDIANINFYGSSKKSKIILFLSLIEGYIRGKNTEQLFEYNSDLQSIEHIIPQKYQQSYNIKDENNIYTIGNLTLLSKPNNSKASNKHFEDKKDIYKNSPLQIVSNLANQDDVNEAFIIKRSKEFAEILLDIFK